ncbi:5-formyltetrahydrofolate cyclo-ligase [Vagococcus zengguangii]
MGSKTNLRNEQLAKRKQLSASYREQAERVMLEKLVLLPEYQTAEMIFCYIGMEDELNTWHFIERFWQDGKQVCVPRVISRDQMEIRELHKGTILERSAFGVLEPTTTSPLVSSEQIHLVLVPCVTANLAGDRLGYGGGFYDRFLKNSQAYTVLCLWQKMIYSAIPVEEHDMKVDKVITE